MRLLERTLLFWTCERAKTVFTKKKSESIICWEMRRLRDNYKQHFIVHIINNNIYDWKISVFRASFIPKPTRGNTAIKPSNTDKCYISAAIHSCYFKIAISLAESQYTFQLVMIKTAILPNLFFLLLFFSNICSFNLLLKNRLLRSRMSVLQPRCSFRTVPVLCSLVLLRSWYHKTVA